MVEPLLVGKYRVSNYDVIVPVMALVDRGTNADVVISPIFCLNTLDCNAGE